MCPRRLDLSRGQADGVQGPGQNRRGTALAAQRGVGARLQRLEQPGPVQRGPRLVGEAIRGAPGVHHGAHHRRERPRGQGPLRGRACWAGGLWDASASR